MRLGRSLLLAAVVALNVSGPALAQDPPAPPRREDPLAREAEMMLDERNLRPTVYNGVKFLALAAQGKLNQADALFTTRGAARQSLQDGKVLDTLRKIDLKPPFSIQCVGFNAMSLDVLTLVYVSTTEAGPVGVKLYVYKHETGVYVGRVDVAEEWTELEMMTDSVLRLPAPLVVNVTASRSGAEAGDVGAAAPAPAGGADAGNK